MRDVGTVCRASGWALLWLACLAHGHAPARGEVASAVVSPSPVIETSTFVAGGPVLRTLVKEAVVAASPAEVFAAWTTPAGLNDFLEVPANVQLRIGGPMELFFAAGAEPGQRGSEGCQILSYVPNEMLSFSWNAPPLFPVERAMRTWVVILFGELPSGHTKLRLTHLGFGEGGNWDDVYDYFDNAWGKVLLWLTRHYRSAD